MSGSPSVYQSGPIYVILVEGFMSNNFVKLFRICASGSGGDAF